ncbi:MAG: DUF4956 domain-containing protein [Arcanobacterium sp.]|nr:DUF4956 domain-containing protein [Arcanobacterium sp.]
MQEYLYIGANLVAIAALVLGIYLPRHRRHDMALSYLVVNLGVLAVATVLAGSTVAAGLGLGLFGVLSIIRLRSDELSQREVAYYFASLALGLLGGLGSSIGGALPLIFMAALVVLIGIFDSKLFNTTESQLIVLDRAIANPEELSAAIAALTNSEVQHFSVVRLDLVQDSTMVRVKLGKRLLVQQQAPAELQLQSN